MVWVKISLASNMQLLTLATVVMLASAGLLCIAQYTSPHQLQLNRGIYPIRVACVGDSITEKSGYPEKLAQMLGNDYSVGNFGVSSTTVTLESDKPYMASSRFQAAMRFHPKIVVIMLGTNDARCDYTQYQEYFEEEYEQLISEFEHLDSTSQVILVRSPPVFDNTLGLNQTTFSNSVIPHIDHIANQLNLPTVDVYDAFANHNEYTEDGVHPTDQGANIIAAQIYQTIITQQPNPDIQPDN